MTVSLDQMITVGPLQIAVLTDCTINVIHRHGIVFFTAHKRPVAFLIKQGEALSAFDPEGNPMTREHVENLCSGAWRTTLEALPP